MPIRVATLSPPPLLDKCVAAAALHTRKIFIVWLALGNAFRSVKHNLLEYTPCSTQSFISKVLFAYYNLLYFIDNSRKWEDSQIL